MSEKPYAPPPWTTEELEILKEMAPANSLKEIAERIGRPPGTVATKALLEKVRFTVGRPEPEQSREADGTISPSRRLMKARWTVGLWKTQKATATFYEGDEGKLPQAFQNTGAWADIEPAPGFSTIESAQSISEKGYYIWPQTVVD